MTIIKSKNEKRSKLTYKVNTQLFLNLLASQVKEREDSRLPFSLSSQAQHLSTFTLYDEASKTRRGYMSNIRCWMIIVKDGCG